MGVKSLKRYSSYKSQPKVCKLFLNFLPNGPHKTTFGIFEILKIEILKQILLVSVNMGPNGSESFNTPPTLGCVTRRGCVNCDTTYIPSPLVQGEAAIVETP